MKLLGIVILYYPDSDIISNISSYLHFLHALIIWNNTPLSNHPKKEFEDLSNSTPIIFMGENENVGIGKALNKAVEYATKKGYTHLLTMDQNSYFDENTFSEYLSKIEKIKNNSVVAFCVNTNKLQLSDSIIKVESFITSGTIMKVEVFKTIGLFREDFFIDAIDTEYSYRIRKNRYQILQFCDIFMHHQLGYLRTVPFLWGKLISSNYSAIRSYYITRNHIITKLLYKNEFPYPKGFFKNILFWRPICIFFVEKNKLRKFYYLLRGIYDGVRMKTGIINRNL